MSQHDLDIANQGFPATRADLNNALQALGSSNSGATAPSTTYANQLWYDTANNIIKIRNEDNDAWISLFTLDQTNDRLQSFSADGGTLHVDATNNRIGINTTSPDEELHIVGQIMMEGTSPTLYLKETDTTDTNFQIRVRAGEVVFQKNNDAFNNSTDVMTLAQDGDVTIDDGNLVLASGHGIDFSATSNSTGTMENELLSDYEQGSFTPTVTDESGNTGTAGESTGYYRKIGGLVHVELRFTNINTTGLTASDDFVVDGLPFTHSSRTGSVNAVTGNIFHSGVNLDFTGNLIALLGENHTYLKFVEMVDSANDHDIRVDDVTSTTADLLMSISYHTNQ